MKIVVIIVEDLELYISQIILLFKKNPLKAVITKNLSFASVYIIQLRSCKAMFIIFYEHVLFASKLKECKVCPSFPVYM